MKNLVSIRDLSNQDLLRIFELADAFWRHRNADPDQNVELATQFISEHGLGRPFTRDRVLATLFFEPSTRTRLSFESAMHRLGGRVIGFSDARTSSVSKGETVADTIRMVSGYADIIAMRHPAEGSAFVGSCFATRPIINAGDGGREHPTQCLLDLFTLQRELGRIEGLKVGLLGDLRFGRTVHSLAQGLSRLGAEIICIAPESMRMPDRFVQFVEEATGRPPLEVVRPEEVIGELDALYVTRIQAERFEDPDEYEAMKGMYVVDRHLMDQARDSCIIMHPLPRVDEVSTELDGDPRSAYIRQSHYGVPVRMALMVLLLASAEDDAAETGIPADPNPELAAAARPCDNPRCILRVERSLPPRFYRSRDSSIRCAYCEAVPQQRRLELR